MFQTWASEPRKGQKGFKTLRRKDMPFNRRGAFVYIRGVLQKIITGEFEGFEINTFEVHTPSFTHRLAWLAPVRGKPKRTYDGYKRPFTPEGEHTPYLVRDILSREKSAEAFQKFVKKFGEDSGLFEGIYVKNFGKQSQAPFELGVQINGTKLRIGDVGYGVSQSLPVLVELFARVRDSWFAIQQPEVHLHPKAQAALGNVIYEIAKQDNKGFFIETHSDYMIDRFRYCFDAKNQEVSKDEKEQKLSAQVVFFQKSERGNIAYPIPILEDGSYSEKQPEIFRQFFIDEELRMLGL